MTTDQQFWWNWWVYFGAAVGTVGSVLVALFGSWLRPSPRLRLELARKSGTWTPIKVQIPDGSILDGKAVWHHLRVRNTRRWATATQVQVMLLQVEEPDAGGQYTTRWIGEVPMSWANGTSSLITRSIGPDAECDLCSLQNAPPLVSGVMKIHPLLWPFALVIERHFLTRLRVTLQPKAIEADGDPLQVEIAWDGQWSDDRKDMESHFVVSECYRPRPGASWWPY